MEYLWSVLLLAGIFTLTAILTGFLGVLIPIFYAFLGFILGAESIIMGLGGLLGSILNYYSADRYVKTRGTLSHVPRYSKLASFSFAVFFVFSVLLKHLFSVNFNKLDYWYLLIFVFAASIVLSVIFTRKRTDSLAKFKQGVMKYKILEKYNDDPKWATYLYLDNGEQKWNQTIPGSFLAKNPKTDLTFVHKTKEDALRYAQSAFKNAEYLENE
jgi:hypothetical protein